MKQIATIAVLVLLASTAHADANDLRFEITPFGAYSFGGTFDVIDTDASYHLDDSSSYGLILNLRDEYNTQWELLYSRQKTDANLRGVAVGDPQADVELQYFQFGGTYQGDGDVVRPYLAATIGGTRIEARASGSASDTFWSGSIGLGVQIQPSSRLGLRLEARAYGTLVDTNSAIFCGSGPAVAGCAVRIRGKILSQLQTFGGVVFRF